MSFSIDASVTVGSFHLSVQFGVEENEIVGLIGPSGCGKTTTLRLISGYLAPDAGTILLNGKNIALLPVEKRNIGFVFQDYALFPHMNVASNIAFGPKMRGTKRSDVKDTVDHYLKLVRLENYHKRSISELSGGEQQRVALARALAPKPDILLLDEPLSALDANLRRRLRREIKKIQKVTRLPTIYVTHDREEALAVSDRIIIMDRGKIIQTGTPDKLYQHPANRFTAKFLGSANIIPGVLVDNKTISTAIGTFRVGKDNCCHSGNSALLFFRPEHCTVTPPETEKNNDKKENRFSIIPDIVEYHGTAYAGFQEIGPSGSASETVSKNSGTPNNGTEDEFMLSNFTLHVESPDRILSGKTYFFSVLPEHCSLLTE